MKLLGHVLVATEAFPERNQKLLAFGSLLPELVFYTKDPALSFNQIHEGGLELYNFCQKYYPDLKNLGIGSMTHSVKYGADNYNSLESIEALGFTPEDIPKISQALVVDIKIATIRAHNLYDLALDYYINKNYPNLKELIHQTDALDKHLISRILSQCFQVSEDNVYKNLTSLWGKYDLKRVESFDGLAKFWQSLASDLIEKDPVDIEKTSKLLEAFYYKLENHADDFISEVIHTTRKRITSVIIEP